MAISKITTVADFEHQKLSVEEYDSMKKLDDFLKLSDFFHVERCENVSCSNCLFIINLRYLYVQNTVHEEESVVPLQKFCRKKIEIFNFVRLFLKTLGSIEKKRVQLEKEFHNTLALCNKPMNPQPEPPPQPLTPPAVVIGTHANTGA